MNEAAKARKHSSPKLLKLLEEITPIEMEQTKVKMQLAARIEDLMIDKGWSKSQFAQKVGKHPSEITKWISGTHNFTIEVLTEIASCLGVKLPELLGQKRVFIVFQGSTSLKLRTAEPVIKTLTPYNSPPDVFDACVHTSHRAIKHNYPQSHR